MTKRLFAIALVFGATTLAWMILGGSIHSRTFETDSRLKNGVTGLWGGAQTQIAPSASFIKQPSQPAENSEQNKNLAIKLAAKEIKCELPLESSKIKTDIDLSHRQKGLLWYATYKVQYTGQYRFLNDSGVAQDVTITFTLPDKQAVYDDFVFRTHGKAWKSEPSPSGGIVNGVVNLAPGEAVLVEVGYRTQGMDSWRYQFGAGVGEVKNFQLSMDTNFRDIDFPADGLAPGKKEKTATGWRLTWDYKHLVSGANIGMVMPQKLQPGPLAGQIAFFAPLSLLFFMVAMLVIGVMKQIDIHPMHFAFISAAFFAFHLLLAYLADQVPFIWAFGLSAAVSVFLVVSYLRLIFGNRFAFGYAGLAQVVYLVLFSAAFFFKGLTGLTITVGAILTLFVLMQVTAKVNWKQVFEQKQQ
ncbi:MAG: inner membrane CreD family protein [Burkholderiales bacterium]|nr:inner membrane CreD family protein [Burkholderiales bacterium]